ncbi:hypothetical protein FACS1894187_22840 [Synergistales bacterium]|nr:hypothetical protein FACS1894187_22840 [Synergistales bacterium]
MDCLASHIKCEGAKKWLIDIYKAVRNIVYRDAGGVSRSFELNDDMRGVMDRMLASEEEIEASRDIAHGRRLADELRRRGVPDETIAKYKDVIERGADKAKAALLRRMTPKTEDDAQKQAATVNATREVWNLREYKTLDVFLRPKKNGGLTLSRSALAEQFGEGIIRTLPEGVMDDNGLGAEEAAELLGYPAGQALIEDLQKVKITPPDKAIAERVKAATDPLERLLNEPGAMRAAVEEALEGRPELTEDTSAGENSREVSGVERQERAERVREIKALSPLSVEVGAPLDKKGAEDIAKKFKSLKNKRYNIEAGLPINTIGKIVSNKGFDVSTIIGDFPSLFGTSIYGWSESETLKEGHKEHPNIKAFHQYVNKFTNGTETYFIRFTVRESKTKTGKPGENNIHSTAISDVNVYKNDGDSQRIRGINPGEDKSPSFIDTRLQEFFDSVNSSDTDTEISTKGRPERGGPADRRGRDAAKPEWWDRVTPNVEGWELDHDESARVTRIALEDDILQEEAKRAQRESEDAAPSDTAAKTASAKAEETKEKRRFYNKAQAERMAAKVAAYRATAVKILKGKRVKDASAAGRYAYTAKRAGEKAYQLAMRGDYKASSEMKDKELFNTVLAEEAAKIRSESYAIDRYFTKFWKNQKRLAPVVGEENVAQILGLLERLGFMEREKTRDKRPLREWLSEQEKELNAGLPVMKWILDLEYGGNDGTWLTWDNLTWAQLSEANDAVKMIERIGRNERRLISDTMRADFAATVLEIVSTVSGNYGEPGTPTRNPESKKVGLWGPYAGSLDRVETLTRLLDNLKNQGTVWEKIYKPIQHASNTEIEMGEKARANLDGLINGLAEKTGGRRAFQKFLTTKFDTGILDMTTDGQQKLYWTGENLLAVMLNWGNETNRERIVMGWAMHGLGMKARFADSEAYYDALRTGTAVTESVLKRMGTDGMWDFTQGVWDMLEEYWPRIAELEEKMTGVTPEKVEAAIVRTNTGRKLRGGYYPVSFDSSKNWLAATREELDKINQENKAQGVRAHTRHGHTKNRVRRLTGMPVRLDLGVLQEHLGNVIHDLAFRAPVRDVNKIIKDDSVREQVTHAIGETAYRQFDGWLKDIAARPGQTGAVSRMTSHFIGRAAAAQLGLKLTTVLGNFSSITVAAWRLGPRGTMGLLRFYTNPFRWADGFRFANKSSAELRNRLNGADAAIREAYEQAQAGVTDTVRKQAERAFYWALGMSERLISTPIWLASYDQGLNLYNVNPLKLL